MLSVETDKINSLSASLDEILISPQSWKSPTLDGFATPQTARTITFGLLSACTDNGLFSNQSYLLPSPGSTRQPVLPAEIWHQIAHEIMNEISSRKMTTKTLKAMALTSRALSLPAQRALCSQIKLYEPKQIDRLVVTLLSKPYLGISCRSLEVKVARPAAIAEKNETDQRRQELSLLPLLALLSRVQTLKLSCMYDLPQTYLALFASLMGNSVKSLSIVSAFGYSRLVYLTQNTLASIFQDWSNLTSVSLSMPWLLHEEGKRLRQDIENCSNLKCLEISGFRGSPHALAKCIKPVLPRLERLVFDCPIDEEEWEDLLPSFSQALAEGNLQDLAFWSWTQALPIDAFLHHRSLSRGLNKITLSAQDVTEEIIYALPKRLSTLVLATHSEFAPVSEADLVGWLLQCPASSTLKHVVVYDPSATETILSNVWNPLVAKKIAVQAGPDPDLLNA